MTVTADQRSQVEGQFVLDRFGHLLRRRLQVAVALKQLSSGSASQTWLVRALDGAIADEVLQLERIGLGGEAKTILGEFRKTLGNIEASRAA